MTRALGILGAVAALFGSPLIGDGTPRRRGGHSQPKKPRVNAPGTKARKKLAARIARARRLKNRGRSHPESRAAKPETPKRRLRADAMLYLASIGKPTSGRQWVRFRRAMRRGEAA